MEGNPKIEREYVSRARDRYHSTLPLLEEMEKAVDDTDVPMTAITNLFFDYIVKANGTALDHVFDAKTYSETLKKHLGSGREKDIDKDINQTLLPSNGLDSYSSFKRTALLYLAGEFGLSSNDPAAHVFLDFDWNWYRRNYVSLKNGLEAFGVTEEEQRRELAGFMKKEGIAEGDLESVMKSLRDMHRENFIRRLTRERAVERLLRRSKKGERPVVRALIHLAGEAISMDEEMHLTNEKAINLTILAAERRGLSRRELFNTMIAVAAESYGQPKPRN